MIADMKNLGPASAAMLARAGIETEEQLKALSSVQAFLFHLQINRAMM